MVFHHQNFLRETNFKGMLLAKIITKVLHLLSRIKTKKRSSDQMWLRPQYQ